MSFVDDFIDDFIDECVCAFLAFGQLLSFLFFLIIFVLIAPYQAFKRVFANTKGGEE